MRRRYMIAAGKKFSDQLDYRLVLVQRFSSMTTSLRGGLAEQTFFLQAWLKVSFFLLCVSVRFFFISVNSAISELSRHQLCQADRR